MEKDKEILDSLKMVLDIEIQGLENLKGMMNHDFIELVKICHKCEGKLILSGMGKSGHIAKKISSTLSSLGTPSLFLHPAEAAHGDLGMVEEKDVLIMISNSGETEELIQLLNSLKIINCRLLSVVCKKNSTLGRHSDLSIVVPIEKEACMNNLAPTTSTTVVMALGDALAVTLSALKDFKKENFALFHPRGMLGKRLLLKAVELNKMELRDIAIGNAATVESALWSITKNHLGAIAVIDEDGKLEGMLTDGDIRRNINRSTDVFDCPISKIMTKEPVTITDDALATDALAIMKRNRISVLPIVCKEGTLMGMISMHDIMDVGIIENDN